MALERVIHDEQMRNARYAVRLRIALTALGSLMWFVIPLQSTSEEVLAPSRIGTFLYLGVALIIGGAHALVPRFRAVSIYGIALFDAVIISIIHHFQLGSLEDVRWMNAPINLIMMFSMILISTLSLSWVVICATVVIATTSMIAMLARCDYGPVSIGLAALALPAIAGVASTLVLRIRGLVRAARQRDLLGKYVLGPRIGAGGMAEVFQATYAPEGGFERQVAIKRILPSFAQDATSIALFRREAQLCSTLAHPNLVQVLDFGRDADTYFLAMEYVDGTNLSTLVERLRERGRRLDEKIVVYVAWCLTDALEHVHGHTSPSGQHQQLVHRDINPPNVLISKWGDVKLADFGIAREVAGSGLTEAGVMRGKMAYSSPEQLAGDRVDGRADLFSLGATLWELLAGKRLFDGADEEGLIDALLSRPIPSLKQAAPSTPLQLVKVIEGLLSRELETRTVSAHVLRQQLNSLPSALLDLHAGRAALSALVTESLSDKASTLMTPTM